MLAAVIVFCIFTGIPIAYLYWNIFCGNSDNFGEQYMYIYGKRGNCAASKALPRLAVYCTKFEIFLHVLIIEIHVVYYYG